MKKSNVTRIHVQLNYKEYFFKNIFTLFVSFLTLILFVSFQILFVKFYKNDMNEIEFKYLYIWLISLFFDVYFIFVIIAILKRKIICLKDIIFEKNQINVAFFNKSYVFNEDNSILSMNKNGLFIINQAEDAELFFSNKIIKCLQSANINNRFLYNIVAKLEKSSDTNNHQRSK